MSVILSKNNDCAFCSEISGELQRSNYCKISNDFSAGRVLWRGKLLTVLPSLGPVFEDHLLLIPNEHILSFAQSSTPLLKSAQSILLKIQDYFLEKGQRRPLVFEHGARCLSGTQYEERLQRIRSGACTDHAHIHIVPSVPAGPICQQLMQLPSFIRCINLPSLLDLPGATHDNHVYIITTDDISSHWKLFLFEILPSQLMRQFLFSATGAVEWDWRQFPHTELVKNTVHKLSPVLPSLLSDEL